MWGKICLGSKNAIFLDLFQPIFDEHTLLLRKRNVKKGGHSFYLVEKHNSNLDFQPFSA